VPLLKIVFTRPVDDGAGAAGWAATWIAPEASSRKAAAT